MTRAVSDKDHRGRTNHHIGKIATMLKPSKHVYRERRLCTGNADYEQKMAEAKRQFDELEARLKATPRGSRFGRNAR